MAINTNNNLGASLGGNIPNLQRLRNEKALLSAKAETVKEFEPIASFVGQDILEEIRASETITMLDGVKFGLLKDLLRGIGVVEKDPDGGNVEFYISPQSQEMIYLGNIYHNDYKNVLDDVVSFLQEASRLNEAIKEEKEKLYPSEKKPIFKVSH